MMTCPWLYSGTNFSKVQKPCTFDGASLYATPGMVKNPGFEYEGGDIAAAWQHNTPSDIATAWTFGRDATGGRDGGAAAKIILTGGLGRLYEGEDIIDAYEPDLVLHGIKLAMEKNK